MLESEPVTVAGGSVVACQELKKGKKTHNVSPLNMPSAL